MNFHEPPSVQLLTGEGLGAIEVEIGDEVFGDFKFLDSILVSLGLPMLTIVFTDFGFLNGWQRIVHGVQCRPKSLD